MGKLATRATKRIMASVLTVAMILSNMTVYASEYSEPAAQTQETAEGIGTDAAELPVAQDEAAQDETKQDEGTQDGTPSGEGSSNPADETEGGDGTASGDTGDDISEPEDPDGNVQDTEETEGDAQEAEDGLDAEEVSEAIEAEEPKADTTGTHTVWVVGDSTVSAFTDNYYLPRYGYGTQIQKYIETDSGYTVNNLALSGRSSLSFLSEGNYTTLKNGIKEGDILIVGFGHNDEKAAADRYTNPNGDWQTAGSFAKNLYDNYVKLATDNKAEVILCTPIVRRGVETDSDTGKTKLKDSEKHITSNSDSYAGGDYRQAVLKLGTDKNVPVVDLTDITTKLYESMTPAETLDFHARTKTLPSSVDNTHLNIYGAKMVAYKLAKEVQDNSYTALASAIAANIAEPTKAADLVPTAGWVDPVYNRPAENVTTHWGDYVIGEGANAVKFKATAFGNLGGANKYKDACELKKEDNGNMYIKAGAGKIGGKGSDGALTGDGIAMYYYRVPVGKTFELSATATVNSITSNNQVAFGLMARDDMYIDNNDSAINSDYVVAGSFGDGKYNCFYRKDGDVVKGEALTTETVAASKSYDLSIVYNGDGYACTFGKEPTQSGGFDFQLTAIDDEYVYIGMFVARAAEVSFKNIYLKVDGQVLADERKTQYEVNVTNDGHGTASANTPASAGETITLTTTPSAGYVLDHWEVVSTTPALGEGQALNIVNNKFTMPAADVEVKAVFAESKFDTATVEAGTKDFTPAATDLTKFAGITFANFEDIDDEQHGFHSKGSGNPIMNLHLEEGRKASITVLSCCYGAGGGGSKPVTSSLTYSAGVVINKEVAEGSLKGIQYSVLNVEEEYVTLTFANDMYIHNIMVEYAPEESGERKIDVWDFGAKEESNEIYTNHITAETLLASGAIATNVLGTYQKSPATFGDLKLYNEVNKDKFYTDVPSLKDYSAGAYANANYKFDEDYTAGGAYYGNGGGHQNRRYVTIDNVKAGDKIVAYMGSAQNGDIEFLFGVLGSASAQQDSEVIKSGNFKKFEFIANYDGTYKIWSSGGDGKPMYHRIMRLPSAEVNGKVDFGDEDITDDYSVKFINLATKAESVADVAEDGSFTVSLAPGYTYKAVLMGAIGYGFTNESSNVVVTDAEAVTGKSGVKLVVEAKSTYMFSGTIKGFAADYDISKLAVKMTPASLSTATEVELDVKNADNKLTFSGELEPNVEYAIVMEGVNDYKVLSPLMINKEDEGTSYENRTILVALKPVYDVIGGFMGLGASAQVTKLTFANIDDGYEYTAQVASGSYSVKLRDGEYLAKATVEGYTTNTHVVVNGGAISKDLMFVPTAAKDNIEYVSDIYVGYPGKANNYTTVSEAVEAAGLMKKDGQARTSSERVAVHIAPGTYREQIIVDAPYVSFVNDTDKEVKLTWYYGIGYVYYSAGTDGYYNAESAYDKYVKKGVSKWGVAVYVKPGATAFRAKGITFENSFNRYITDEELIDGAEPAVKYTTDKVYSDTSIAFDRKYGIDVTSNAATERASALAVEADQVEFLNCGFYSSQDTLYTGNADKVTAHIYFKNCVIEGQTDYIFGKSNCVFDACELSWKGYSKDSKAGHITAVKPDAGQAGYLFRNCTVTANSYNKLTVTPGDFGRPWGGVDASATFMNTKLQSEGLIVAEGWGSMKVGNEVVTPDKAKFREYNTTTMDGKAVSTSGRPANTLLTAEQAAAITISDYFGEWKPECYKEEGTTVAFSVQPVITNNGDLNTPYPGNTLTVGYSLGDANNANDASVIQWYRVKGDNETLVKTSNAVLGKTYKITTEDVGAYIKVVVTPATISGTTGTAASHTMAEAVRDGYEDPDKPGGDVTLGDGINIFLVGDSTVKDYSASGMNSGGTARNEGAWGEFFQSYFDSESVTVVNYANGGRSSRNFINEGSLAKVAQQIGEGDYMFIQFGHNDCSSEDSYLADRFVPLGTPTDGIYPSNAGVKQATPSELNGKGYGDTCYTYDCGGTFKWYLQQYIDVALEAGAIPVLVTPVARMYYNSDGTIKAHHDAAANAAHNIPATSNNAYVEAVKQLAEENKDEGVLLVDGFKLTKELFEDAYTAGSNDVYGTQIMHKKEDNTCDKTHNNKLGGMIEAAAIADAVQKMDINISYAVKAPSEVRGVTTEGTTVFAVDSSSNITAYDINSGYTSRATYWEGIGQTMIDAISAKAVELGAKGPAGSVNAPTATPLPGAIEKGSTVTLEVVGATEGSIEIYYTTDGTNPKADGVTPELYDNPIAINENTTIKAYAKEKAADGGTATLADSKVVTYEYTLLPSVKAPTVKSPEGTVVEAGTVVKLASDPADAQIRYTMGANPADPTIYSPLYDDTKGIVITAATTIKAIAVKDGEVSAVSTFAYTIAAGTSATPPNPPTFTTPGGDVSVGTVVKLNAESGALIYYTMGKNPAAPTTSNADIYDDESGIVINKSATIKAIAVKNGISSTTAASATYTVPTVKEPEIDKAEGLVAKGTQVTLTPVTEGSEIYYTIDKTDPRTSATRTKYKKALTIDETTTVKAYAVKAGFADSEVVIRTYKVLTVKATPADGKLPSTGGTVELKATAEGADIYYVTSETAAGLKNPEKTEDNKYKEPIDVTKNIYIRAIAVLGDMESAPVDLYFTITGSETPNPGGGDDEYEAVDGKLEIKGLDDKKYTFTGAKITPDFEVWDNGIVGKTSREPKLLTLGIDYTVKYANNVKVSKGQPKQPTVTVVGKGNYVGKDVTKTFEIVAESTLSEVAADTPLKNLKGAKLDKIAPQDFTGDAIYPDFKIIFKDKSSATYTYVEADRKYTQGKNGIALDGAAMNVNVALSNNKNKGTATILITGEKVNGKSTSIKKTFKINPVDLSKAGTGTLTDGVIKNDKIKITVEQDAKYLVKGAMPKVTVGYNLKSKTADSDANEEVSYTKLIEGKDYTVKYLANKKASQDGKKGSIVITGKGNYAKKYAGKLEFEIGRLDMANTKLVAAAYAGVKGNKVKATVVDQNGDVIKAAQYTVKAYKEKEQDDDGKDIGKNAYTAADKKGLEAGTTIYVQAEAKDTKNLTGKTDLVKVVIGENIAKAKVVFAKKSQTYTGEQIRFKDGDLTVTIKIKGQATPQKLTLKSEDETVGADEYAYKIVKYSNNINKGTATAVIEGVGKCSGTKTIKFKISAKTMQKKTD